MATIVTAMPIMVPVPIVESISSPWSSQVAAVNEPRSRVGINMTAGLRAWTSKPEVLSTI